MKPIIALAMGDPAGISPELTAKILAADEVDAKARLVVIGDRRVLDDGAKTAAVKLDLMNVPSDPNIVGGDGPPVFIDLGHLDPRLNFVAQELHRLGRWPDKDNPGTFACIWQYWILGKKAIAGVKGIAPGLFCGLDNSFNI